MKEFISHGLTLGEVRTDNPNEQRAEIRLASDCSLVAWFQSTRRMSGGQQVVSTNTQFVQRDELLTFEQVSQVNDWLVERTIAARWGLISYAVLVEAA